MLSIHPLVENFFYYSFWRKLTLLRGTTERRMKSFQQIRQRQNKTCLSFTLLKVIIFKSCVDLSLLEQWLVHTIVFHCSEMAPLSDRTSVQSKNLKKYSKLLTRAFQITYFILILIYRWIMFKKIVLWQFLGSKLLF